MLTLQKEVLVRKRMEILVRSLQEVSEYYEQVKFSNRIYNYREIAEMVMEYTGWNWDSITLKRKKDGAFRRGIIDLIATTNGCTLNNCAQATFRDHTTVMHSLRAIEDRLDTDRLTRNLLGEIMKYLKEREEFQ